MSDRERETPQAGESRRDAVKKMAYAAPFVISLAASPAFASSGSGASLRHGESHSTSGAKKSINN